MQAKNKISSVSIIGSGNVATALGTALFKSGVNIVEVFSPNQKNAELLSIKTKSNFVTDIHKLNPNSDIYIVATPDKEVSKVILELAFVRGIVVHTSGSEPINVFADYTINYGVFYPLQTFTVGKNVDFKNIPICIEGSNKATIGLLHKLAQKISNNVVILSSEQRQYLHLTAVTVNNFTNLLHTIAHDLLQEKDIDFSLLHPLIKETANKIDEVKPGKAQTGPAHRNDVDTINRHLELLAHYPEYKKIYSLLSNQIIKKYND